MTDNRDDYNRNDVHSCGFTAIEMPQPEPGEDMDTYMKRLALYAFRCGCRWGFNQAMDVMNHNFSGLEGESPELAAALKTLTFRVRETGNEVFDQNAEGAFVKDLGLKH